jgi:HTH-type transcriptional regulator/antitoxin HipB
VEYLLTNWARVGDIVREQRRASRMTQAALAQAAGVSRAWVVRLERGQAGGEPSSVMPVLRALGLELVVRPSRPEQDEVDDEAFVDDLLRGDA